MSLELAIIVSLHPPYMTVHLVTSLPAKKQRTYIHRIYAWFWPILHSCWSSMILLLCCGGVIRHPVQSGSFDGLRNFFFAYKSRCRYSARNLISLESARALDRSLHTSQGVVTARATRSLLRVHVPLFDLRREYAPVHDLLREYMANAALRNPSECTCP